MINLDNVCNENKSILDTYKLKNSRKIKNKIFVPYNSDLKNDNVKDVNNSSQYISEEDTSLSVFVDKMFAKHNEIDIDIQAFLQGEYDEFMGINNKKENSPKTVLPIQDNVKTEFNNKKEDSPKTVLPIQDNIKTEFNNKKEDSPKTVLPIQNNVKIGLDNKKDVKDSYDLTDFLKSYNTLSSEETNNLNEELISILEETYSYLFDTLETFSAVYEDYLNVFENIEQIKIFTPIKNPSKINVRNFLLKYRKAEKLPIKLNMIGLAIGDYNLHLIVDKYKNSTAFVNKPKNEFLNNLKKIYNGTEYDVAYLKEFLEVVKGDLSGQYVFEELEEKKQSTVDESSNDKKVIIKKKNLFSSLNNKK